MYLLEWTRSHHTTKECRARLVPPISQRQHNLRPVNPPVPHLKRPGLTTAKIEEEDPIADPPLQREHSDPKDAVPARLPVRLSCRDALSMLCSRDLSLPHIREGEGVGLGVGHGKGCILVSETPVVGDGKTTMPRWGDGRLLFCYTSDIWWLWTCTFNSHWLLRKLCKDCPFPCLGRQR